MMKTSQKRLLRAIKIAAIVCAALSCTLGTTSTAGTGGPHFTLNTAITQTKVLKGLSGQISIALTLSGSNEYLTHEHPVQPVDLVIVLDRSGSMAGQKIIDARNGIIQLINYMGSNDRMAFISYSNNADMLSPLVRLGDVQREQLSALVWQTVPGGGTNLESGLQMSINAFILRHAPSNRQRRIMLISDGLANQGTTSPRVLGEMAARATEMGLGVSTVGVGYDFNEHLLTTIADYGAGNYYFLDNPSAFAEIFKKEFESTRSIIANSIELKIPLNDGVQLLGAGGYPINIVDNTAVVRLGDLLAGQQRKIYITYNLPTDKLQSYVVGEMELHYRNNGQRLQVTNDRRFKVDCITDKAAAIASIDKEMWSEQVVKENFYRLKDTVADAVRKGEKMQALRAIEEYESKTGALNKSVGSAAVSRNLEVDIAPLKQSVEQTFSGAPAAVAEKRRQQAKELQYESYRIRRSKE